VQQPRRQLVCISVLAVASFGILLVARPPLTGAFWSRGDDLALAVAWGVALAASAWLTLATGACVIALGFARPQLARRIAPGLPCAVRRLVEIAIVSSCIALPAVPALAAGPLPAPHAYVTDQPVVRTAVPVPRAVVPATIPAPVIPAVVVPAVVVPPVVVPPAAARHVVVRAGDNLWLIARATLGRGRAGNPTDTDVARYWRAVIAANRATLRSGDPSLIFPGEMITLPPAPGVS
jgi:nucleoid-associated protein YgaU